MMIRLHRLLRLFVLIAMTLSIGESVWISMCADMPGMSSQAASADDMADMPGMPGSCEDSDNQNDPACPFGPVVVAQGCTLAALLPASAGPLLAAPEGHTAPVGNAETLPERIYATPPFHPPRA